MWPTTLTYQAAIRGPHRRSVKVDVYDIDGNPRALGLRPTSGFVEANLTNRVTRNAQFTLTRPFYPLTADDPLSPEHAVVQISAGIRYGTYQEELFPLFRGRIWDATLQDNGQVRFDCEDLAADVVGYRFEQPRTTSAGTTLNEIRNLILEALPQAVFGTDTVTDAATPQSLTWDEDRGQALDDLASSLGGRWFANGAGEFTVRPFDYQLGAVAQEFRDGPGGLLTGATVLRSRAGVSNSIVVVSERTDGSPPIRVPARDSTTGSPTRFGGLFGRVSTIINVQTPISFTAAQTLAQTQLQSSIALGRQWTANVVPDLAIEPGDTVDVEYMDVRDRQIIDSIRYPLETDTPMQIATRAGSTTGVS